MKRSNLVILFIGLFLLLITPTAFGQRTSLVSWNEPGTGGGNNASGGKIAVSATGRFVAFVSSASDLVPNDTNNNGIDDVFLRDTLTGTTTLVSVNDAGTGSGNAHSSYVSAVSADGKRVLFASQASNLVHYRHYPNIFDLYMRDLTTGTTTLLSLSARRNSGGNANTSFARFSADESTILFTSEAGNLIPNDANGPTAPDLFVYDVATGVSRLVSVNRAGTAPGNGGSSSASISADGRFVVFVSTATDLVENDTNSGIFHDVFVRDVVAGTTELVDVNLSGNSDGSDANRPSISADGRYVAFAGSGELVSGYPAFTGLNVFVRDMLTHATKLVSVNMSGTGPGNSNTSNEPVLSPNGRFITFTSGASDLTPGDSGTRKDVFQRDLLTGTTRLVSVSTTGTSGDQLSSSQLVSDDGRFVTFWSQAKNLVPVTIVGNWSQVFVRDMWTQTTVLASLNSTGNGGGNGNSQIPSMSANGMAVVFSSFASNLIPNDLNNSQDVFVFRPGHCAGDFDGDGKSDPAVWNPSSGMWSALGSFDGATRTQAWGASSLGDVPVAGDYDGDGKADLAVFRPGEGLWYILQSSSNSVMAVQWGHSVDRPVPADYDGDARTDVAVFRPSEGAWYILQSRTQSARVQSFGLDGDKLVPADYDADGKADLAVYRPGESTWHVSRSSDGLLTSRQWGNTTDKPVAADYDGDGKTDLAVFHPGDQSWHILNSADNSSRVQQFGLASDLPVPGEFDGDGKADIAVFRQGVWYIWQSSNQSLRTQQLGESADVPVTSSLF